MPKEMQELECEDGYVLMAEAAAQPPRGTKNSTSANHSNNTNIKSLLAMARTSSSASSYASGQAVEKMAQRARARPQEQAKLETITSNDDSNTNNAIMESLSSSPQSAAVSQQQQSFGQQQQGVPAINQNPMTTSTQGALVRQDEDVILVETVHEDDDDDDTSCDRKGTTDKNHQLNKDEYNPPQEVKHGIPMAMTVVAIIFIVATTTLVFQSTRQPVWLVLLLACISFTSLVVVLVRRDYWQDGDDTRATTTRRPALILGSSNRGPLWEMACTEYRNFQQDWREQVVILLLLKNEAENPIPDHDEPVTPAAAAIHLGAMEAGYAAGISNASTSSLKNDQEPAIIDTTNDYNENRNRSFLAGRKSRPQSLQQQQQPQLFENKQRPKSKIFRVLVKPILLPAAVTMMMGRKRREQRRREALDLEAQVENGGVAILS